MWTNNPFRAKTKRIVVVSAMSLAVFATATFLVAFLAAQRVERRARECYAEILKLQVGRSTFADVTRLVDRYGGFPWITPIYKGCSPQACSYAFTFQNLWLSRFHLAPHVELTITIGIEDDRVVSRTVSWTPGFEASLFIVELPAPPDGSRSSVTGSTGLKTDTFADWKGRPSELRVFMTTAVPSERRQAAYSIDLSCLGQLGSCKAALRTIEEKVHVLG
jgi:hypothetical protein